MLEVALEECDWIKEVIIKDKRTSNEKLQINTNETNIRM